MAKKKPAAKVSAKKPAKKPAKKAPRRPSRPTPVVESAEEVEEDQVDEDLSEEATSEGAPPSKPVKKIDSLTPEQEALQQKVFDNALLVGTSTAPALRQQAEEAITELYKQIGSEKPEYIWVQSPAAACVAQAMLCEPANDDPKNFPLRRELRTRLRISMCRHVRIALIGQLMKRAAVVAGIMLDQVVGEDPDAPPLDLGINDFSKEPYSIDRMMHDLSVSLMAGYGNKPIDPDTERPGLRHLVNQF